MAEQCSILFVDDEPKAGELLLRFCEDGPYQCHVFRDPLEAMGFFRADGADLIITDLRMPGIGGIELLGQVRELDRDVPVIIITAHSTLDSAIEALRLGATDFLKKPFDMEELLVLVDKTLERTQLKRENRLLRQQLRKGHDGNTMIGTSREMQDVHGVISKIADVRCNVIIQGESGTGKELIARAIHNVSQDSDKPLVVIDCGALSDTLLESELFGHEKGAFTGAAFRKRGLLEVTAGGTVFLDEIGNISEGMQIKLLRVIQEQQITRVGSVRPINIDVRFVVATNQDLEILVQKGRFRADLYHRLNVLKISIPPLRERREDIPDLIRYFVEMFASKYNRTVTSFSAESMRRLFAYDWPGNVRELRNVVERHVALASDSILELERLPEGQKMPGSEIDVDFPTLFELERRYLLKMLNRFGGNRTRAAEALGIDKSTLWRRLQHYADDGEIPDVKVD